MSYTLLDNRDKDLINQDINKVSEQYNIKNKFGSSIVVNDSADFSIMGMKLYGKTTQPTTTGKNLFDIDTVKTNYINPGTGVEEANDSWKNTPSISCKANTTYTFSMKTKEFFQFAVSFYDSNKNFISGDSKSDYNITQYTFTTPSNTSFMRVGYSFKLSSGEVVRDEIMLNEGTEALPWEKFSGGQPSPSPQYPQPLESKGKWGNLFNNTATSKTDNGLTYTVNKDKSITVIGTPTGASSISIGRFDKKGEFILTLGTNIKNMVYEVNVYNSKEEVVGNFTTVGRTFNTNDYNDYSYMFIVLKRNENVYTNETVYPMISTEDIPYRPYTGQREIESGVYGKNLVTGFSDKTSNGITFTVNADGSITTNGTALSNTHCTIRTLLPKGKYIISGCPNGGGVNAYRIYITDELTFTYVSTSLNNNETFELVEETDVVVGVHIYTGTTVSNLTFYPMIRKAEITDGTYEPYTKQSHISLVGDGLKGIPVTDASLATYTDENGQMWCSDYVDCERGVLVQRIFYHEYDGSEDIRMEYTNSFYDNELRGLLPPVKSSNKALMYCSHLESVNSTGNQGFNNCYVSLSGRFNFEIMSIEHTVDAFKQFVIAEKAKGTPFAVSAILATPIEIPLSADEIASYKALKSNYKVTSVMNDCDAEMEIKYAGDAYTSGLSDVINKSIDNKVGNIDSKVLVNGAEYGIDRIQIEKTDGQLQLVFRAADGTRKGAINFDLAETTTE